ncbi:OapA family protein [Edaphovirga cremea]|uniref:OapA family protein n=1 Tax=Edaphovirga cremea TaxID=2267246 RepID=UPI0039891D9F
MGRIAPRRRKTTRIYQPMLRSWVSMIPKFKREDGSTPREVEDEADAEVDAETKTETDVKTTRPGPKEWLNKIWHLPDNFGWMQPLPPFHRRWILIAALVVVIAILWPSSSPSQFPVQSVPDQTSNIPLQAELTPDNASTRAPVTSTEQTGNWREYQIQSGQTLAQLFRDNNLVVNDVFAMAQVEGSDKPLSNLKSGQQVKIQQNANGVVTALEIETTNNVPVRFSRQSDGSYRRDR